MGRGAGGGVASVEGGGERGPSGAAALQGKKRGRWLLLRAAGGKEGWLAGRPALRPAASHLVFTV